MRIAALTKPFAIGGIAVCVACTHPVTTRNPVFANPPGFVGQEVEVCGYIDGPNILESADREDWVRTGGISIVTRGPLDSQFEGPICVAGILEYLGCEREVCTGAAFDYAIRISRVASPASP